MRLSNNVINEARQRDGEIDEGRDEEINELLDTDKLGYEEGDPLVADSYDDYPTLSDLTNPQQRGFLVDLLSNDNVNSIDDAINEILGATGGTIVSEWRSAVEQAIEVFDINADELLQETDDDNNEDTLTEILGYDVADDVADDLLIAELYVKGGLSASEIADVLETDEKHVMDRLKHVNLVNGKTRKETRDSFEDNKGRLSSASNGGLTIDTNKL